MTSAEFDAKWAAMTADERDSWVGEVVLGHSAGIEYTRRIANAWIIVRAWQEMEFSRGISLTDAPCDVEWEAEALRKYDGFRFGYAAEADNAPEALCKAILMAVLEAK